MRLTFRMKLMTIVSISAIAFSVLIGVGIFLVDRMEHELAAIQETYIPLLELGPRLESNFHRIQRAFQDSVSAQDRDALKNAKPFKDDFDSAIAAAKNAISAEGATELRNRMEDYYSTAYGLSRRLIAGETGVAIVHLITLMHTKQTRVTEQLNASTTLDRGRLIKAFSEISKTQAANGHIQIFISALCLVVVVLLSLSLSRSVLRSLSAFSSGLKRFGQGDFSHPIQTTAQNEFSDLAHEANQMAHRIQCLLKELESFSYSVAHDLRAPLRSIVGFSGIVIEEHGPNLPADAKQSLERVVKAANKMGQLIDGLLGFSRLTRREIKKEWVDLSVMVNGIVTDLKTANPERNVDISIAEGIAGNGDPQLLQVVLTNLLGNAWKFTSKKPNARIEFGAITQNEKKSYYVRDNGAGFDMKYSEKLFGTFQRLHTNDEFEGTGIGLATVQNIINRHGGRIWAEAKIGEGAAFYFTL